MAKKYVAVLVLGLLWLIQELKMENCFAVAIVAVFCHFLRDNKLLMRVADILDKVGSKVYKSCFGFTNYVAVDDAKKYEDSNGDNLLSFDRRTNKGRVSN